MPLLPFAPKNGSAMKLSSPFAPQHDVAKFVIYVAVVLTTVMVLFPPFTSLSGTEYAFILSGPEWSRRMANLGTQLGLEVRIYWALLLMQLLVVWAIAFGAYRFLARAPQSLVVSALILTVVVPIA